MSVTLEPIRLYAKLELGDHVGATLYVSRNLTASDGFFASVSFNGAEAGPPLAVKATFDRWAEAALGRELVLGQDDAPAEPLPPAAAPEADPGGSIAPIAEAVAMVPNEAAAHGVAPGHGRPTRTFRPMEYKRTKMALVLLALVIVFGLVWAGETPAAATMTAATVLMAATAFIPLQRS